MQPKPITAAMGACALSAVLLLGACAGPVTTNEPLATATAPAAVQRGVRPEYRWSSLADTASPQVLVLLAFSGGGKRSAAFSYGVLQGLRDYAIAVAGRPTTLLNQVKFISAVSGGSFTAAYYGLFRDRIFRDYEREFLKQDLESQIYGLYLLPWNWAWMMSSTYGTNDHMAAVYDRMMFHGATYADLARQGKPLISVNATDISFGISFAFTQEQFDMVCSDLASYPIARAVAASNGFPVLFTPITLRNHADRCALANRPAALRGDVTTDTDPTRVEYVKRLYAKYSDTQRAPYVHLMDGGISDNLALRGLINSLLIRQDRTGTRTIDPVEGFTRVRRIVVVLADGQAINQGEWARQRTVTGIGQIFNAVSGTQIDQYNFETVLLAKQEFENLAALLRKKRCATARTIDGHGCADVEVHFAHLSLASVADPAVRARLEKIPTGLTIPDDDVDRIAAAGATAVRESSVLRQMRLSLGRQSARRQ